MRFPLHMLLHFLVPAMVATVAVGWRRRRGTSPTSGGSPPTVSEPGSGFWRQVGGLWCILIATMAVDLDHLLADPIFDPGRCSLGYHPLHTWPAIALYVVLSWTPKWRWWGVGLLIHMFLDGLDCWLMK